MKREWDDAYEFGRGKEMEYVSAVPKMGAGVAIPCFAASHMRDRESAPIVVTADSRRISPDVLRIVGGTAYWDEVKAKKEPTWSRRFKRWEHGIDYALFEEYRAVEVASGSPVNIALFEQWSPTEWDRESPLIERDGGEWLYITLIDAIRHGTRRHDWPGGQYRPKDRGKDGKGGLLWARHHMRFLDGHNVTDGVQRTLPL